MKLVEITTSSVQVRAWLTNKWLAIAWGDAMKNLSCHTVSPGQNKMPLNAVQTFIAYSDIYFSHDKKRFKKKFSCI